MILLRYLDKLVQGLSLSYKNKDVLDLCTCKTSNSKLCVDLLHTYQHEGSDFILDKHKVALWLDLGLGKGVITLSAIKLLKNDFKVNKVLVIAPKLVAETVWDVEIESWCHLKDLSYAIVVGSKKERLAALAKDADITITNRENVDWLIREYFGIDVRSKGHKFPYDMVVLDESSSFKNWTAKRSKALRLVTDNIQFMVQLTATPTPQGYIDLFSQMYMLKKDMLKSSNITQYSRDYFYQLPTRALKLHSWAAEKLDDMVKPYVMSMKAIDYLDMPKRADVVINIPMPPKVAKQYQEFEKEYMLDEFGGTNASVTEIIAVNAGVLKNKLRQFSSGFLYTNDDPPQVVRIHDLKVKALKEILEDNNDNIAIIYNYKQEFEDIISVLPKRSWGDAKKSEDIKSFQNGELQYILLHPMSASMGLNLQKTCHRMIWYSPTWNLEESLQMDGRIDRQGQAHSCLFQRLAVGKVEYDIATLLANKDKVMQSMLESVRHISEDTIIDDDDEDIF